MLVKKYKTIQNEDNIPILIKEESKRYSEDNKFDSSKKIYELMKNVYQLDRQTEEYIYLLCFDNKLKLKATFEVSHGTVNGSLCEPSGVFVKAMLCGAVRIILVHNHPSGDTTPSAEDKKLTERIKKAGELLNIQLLDHVIVGDNYYSFAENKEI